MNVISDTLERSQLELPFYSSIQFLHRKIKRSARPCSYCANSSATRQLLLCCGDIATNPGPCTNTTKIPKTKCPKCEKTVRKHQCSAVCQVCYDQLHVKCTDLELTKVKKQLIQNQLMVKNWTCSRCLFCVLPFHSVRSIDQQHEDTNQNDSISSDAVNEHLEALTSRPNQLRLVHINTQSMVSSFDELILLMKEYPYDVITMSETWLKNNPHLLN